jgi:putative tryptophan/tyrosine transport system substrate-binding protein
MRRRDFITLLGVVTLQSAARAQQPGTQVVGFLGSGSHDPNSSTWAAFLQGMRGVGNIAGQNVSFEFRYAEDQYDRLPALAESLVSRDVSAIVADSVVSAHDAKAAMSTIPIVFVSGIDPVKNGLVASLNHPGANLTGVFFFTGRLAAKRLERLRALVPKAKLIGVLVDPKNLNFEVQLSDVRDAAREIGQDILIVNASAEADLHARSRFSYSVGSMGLSSVPTLYSIIALIVSRCSLRAVRYLQSKSFDTRLPSAA